VHNGSIAVIQCGVRREVPSRRRRTVSEDWWLMSLRELPALPYSTWEDPQMEARFSTNLRLWHSIVYHREGGGELRPPVRLMHQLQTSKLTKTEGQISPGIFLSQYGASEVYTAFRIHWQSS
jgi:hypothetical protein